HGLADQPILVGEGGSGRQGHRNSERKGTKHWCYPARYRATKMRFSMGLAQVFAEQSTCRAGVRLTLESGERFVFPQIFCPRGQDKLLKKYCSRNDLRREKIFEVRPPFPPNDRAWSWSASWHGIKSYVAAFTQSSRSSASRSRPHPHSWPKRWRAV